MCIILSLYIPSPLLFTKSYEIQGFLSSWVDCDISLHVTITSSWLERCLVTSQLTPEYFGILVVPSLSLTDPLGLVKFFSFTERDTESICLPRFHTASVGQRQIFGL